MQDSVVITWSDFGYIPFMWHLSSFCTSINLVISSGEARAITSDNGPLSRVQSNTVLFRHSLYLIVGHSYHFLNKYENNERLVLGTWSITFFIIIIIIIFLDKWSHGPFSFNSYFLINDLRVHSVSISKLKFYWRWL